MKNFAAGVLLVLTLSACGLGQECTSKLQDFVNKSGYKMTVARPCKVWIANDILAIPQGDGLQGKLLIGEEGEMGVIGTVVQPKAKLDLSAETLLKLMKLNNELDYAKIGIDNDGDLFVRAELRISSLTADDFTASLKQVIASAKQVYEALKK